MATKEPLEDALKYLAAVPKTRASVSDVDVRPQFRGRTMPVWQCVEEWATAHNLKMTTDREDNRPMALTYFFTNK